MVIYKLTNTINGKVYIGQTKKENIKDRLKCHKHAASDHMLIHKEIRSIGFCFFKAEVLCTTYNKDLLNYLEDFYIELYQSRNPEKGYNVRFGGTRGKMSENGRKVLSEKSKGHKRCVGRKYTEETLSKTRKRITCSNGNTYDGVGVAAKKLGINRHNISSVLTGKLKKAGGLTFKYLEVV